MKAYACILLLVAVFLSGCGSNQTFQTEITEVSKPVEILVPGHLNLGIYSTLPNKKYGWGLKKNKNAPPDIPNETKELLASYGGIYKDDAEKTLYLTFDEGYENGYTGKILDVLKKTQTPACFFVTGPYLDKEQALIRRMVDEGHIVGNHTVHHPSMPSVLDSEKLKEEITALSTRFFEQTGQEMRFFRPPMGEYSARTLAITQDLGYTSVFWSFAYQDWDVNKQRGTDYAYTQIMDGVHDGAILLLHAVSKDNQEVLERVICDLKNQGYRFLPLTEFGKTKSDGETA